MQLRFLMCPNWGGKRCTEHPARKHRECQRQNSTPRQRFSGRKPPSQKLKLRPIQATIVHSYTYTYTYLFLRDAISKEGQKHNILFILSLQKTCDFSCHQAGSEEQQSSTGIADFFASSGKLWSSDFSMSTSGITEAVILCK